MRISFDFHIHSCLSPCGEAEMTPANLANMAALLGLDAIALTDHNTTGNCAAAMRAGARAGVLVLPGMELCTSEEIHVICLFDELEKAEAFGRDVAASLPGVKNRPGVFGRQIYMDHEDLILGEEPELLVAASSIGVGQVGGMAAKYGGVWYPAHIDRPSFSVLSNLGMLPPELGLNCAELTRHADAEELSRAHPVLRRMRLLRASDAHSLAEMCEPGPGQLMELPEKSRAAVLHRLRESAASGA